MLQLRFSATDKKVLYLYSFTIDFHGSYREIHADCRALRRRKETLSKSFHQACFSDVRISNQDDFEEIVVIIHYTREVSSD